MAVTLKTLILSAPFPEEEKKMLLDRYDELNEDDKYKLSNKIWQVLSIQYFTQLDYEREKILLEIQEGKRQYNPNDFVEVRAKMTHEIAQKLEAAGSQESIEEVKQQLEKYKTQPMPQDKTA